MKNLICALTLALNLTPLFAATVSEGQSVVDTIKRVYSPIFAERGFQFKIITRWNLSTANAFAYIDEKNPTTRGIMLYGGLLRSKYMDQGLLALTLCHEIGHHLATKILLKGPNPMAAEGEADYYASAVCLKKILPELSDTSFTDSTISFPKCQNANINHDLCNRIAKVTQNFALWNSSLAFGDDQTRWKSTPSIFTPLDDSFDAKEMIMDHPSIQCRVDTIIQGVLCNGDDCEADLVGGRPGCWYKPTPKDQTN